MKLLKPVSALLALTLVGAQLFACGKTDTTTTPSDGLDENGFFKGVIESGNSSFKYLQNVYTVKNVGEQGLSLALCLAEIALKGKKAAYRVHGGGFAGTIQAFVKTEDVPAFRKALDSAFGEGATTELKVRPYGAIRIQ